MENNNTLKLKDNNGNNIEIEVLDIINNEDLNKEYMVYRIKDQEDVLISIINQTETNFSLDTIEDANEFKAIEDYLESKINDNQGELSLWI